jgi:hypothetical protein
MEDFFHSGDPFEQRGTTVSEARAGDLVPEFIKKSANLKWFGFLERQVSLDRLT